MCQRQVSALAEEHVPSQLLRHPLIQFQRGIVKGNAFGCAVVRAQDCGVAAAGSGTQIALVEQRDLAYAVLLAEIVGGSEPMYTGANDDHIVAGVQVVTAPHPVFAEQLHAQFRSRSSVRKPKGCRRNSCPACTTASQTDCAYSRLIRR